MKRAAGLHEWSRRDFCVACTSVAGVVAIAGCSDGTGAVGTGGLNGSNGGGPDAPGQMPIDAPSSSIDAPSGATCSASATDAGDPAAVGSTPTYVSAGRFFIAKDGGGYYAFSALCTHEGAVCRIQSNTVYCPRHGAKFSYNGAVISGPVSRALAHYSVCKLANGHLGVVTSQTVAATVRFTP